MANFSWSWSEKQHKKWALIHARGMTRFVVFSVFAWGVPMFLVMAVAPALFNVPFPARPSATYWIWQPLLWLGASLFYGFGTWYWSEHFFRKHEKGAP